MECGECCRLVCARVPPLLHLRMHAQVCTLERASTQSSSPTGNTLLGIKSRLPYSLSPCPPPHTHTPAQFFSSGWNFTEFASNALLVTNVGIWWYLVVNHMRPFNLSLRHDVYQTLAPQVRVVTVWVCGRVCMQCCACENALTLWSM